MIEEYENQAKEFMEKTNTEFYVKFLEYNQHFHDDKDKRDIYLITLKRGDRSYSFRFGQSVVKSGEYEIYGNIKTGEKTDFVRTKIHLPINKDGKKSMNIKGFDMLNHGNSVKNKEFAEPTPYDVFSCMTKNDVGSILDFCADYGYNSDSIKAEKIYNACKEEYDNLCKLYSDEEMQMLQEIQ